MNNFELTIKVEDGNFFEGSLSQWEDCIFAFPVDFSVDDKLSQIQDYCLGYGYELVFSWRAKKNDSKLIMTVR